LQSVGIDLECDAHIYKAHIAHNTRILDALHEYTDVFDEAAAATPPQFKTLDYLIPLIEGKEPPYRPLYNLSSRKLKLLREYLEQAL
jgi:hypothetical protein